MNEENLQPVSDEDLILKPFVTLDVPEEDGTPATGPDGLSEFDQRYREPFTGLLYLGKLEKTVYLFGHSFELRTPSQAEKIEIGLLHKPYVNSMASELAWGTLTLAAYLRSIDGTPLPEPLGPKDSGLKERFDWIVNHLRSQIVQALFTECVALETKVDNILKEFDRLGESSG